jgi:hypothetical protein
MVSCNTIIALSEHCFRMLESYLDEHHHGDNDEMTILSTDIDQLNVDSTNTALLNEKLVDINKAATVHGVCCIQYLQCECILLGSGRAITNADRNCTQRCRSR